MTTSDYREHSWCRHSIQHWKSHYNSNKQKMVALAVSAATVLAHFGLATYVASSENSKAAADAGPEAGEEM